MFVSADAGCTRMRRSQVSGRLSRPPDIAQTCLLDQTSLPMCRASLLEAARSRAFECDGVSTVREAESKEEWTVVLPCRTLTTPSSFRADCYWINLACARRLTM